MRYKKTARAQVSLAMSSNRQRFIMAAVVAGLCGLMAGWLYVSGPVGIARAGATIIVQTLDDTSQTECTLRDAITSANNDNNSANPNCTAGSGNDIISFAPGLQGTLNLNTALPAINSNLSLIGPGANKLTVTRNATANFRILTISAGHTVVVQGLTLANGSAVDPNSTSPASRGGAISVDSSAFSLYSAVISDNQASSDGGGLYATTSTLVISNTVFSGNDANQSGGGVSANESITTITGSTVTSNTALSFGGGIHQVGTSARATINNTTVSFNTGQGGGGGIANFDGEMTVQSSTIVSNSSGSAILAFRGGGGIQNFAGNLTVTNSSVAGNQADGPGGGIYNRGTDRGQLQVIDSTIATNKTVAGGQGGGIASARTVAVNSSTISGNVANAEGGGVWILNSLNVISGTIVNSTLSGNQAGDGGGGIFTRVALSLSSSTVYSNSALAPGGGLDQGGGAATLITNTIFARNTGGAAPDIAGTIDSGGYNLIENPSGATVTGDLTGNLTGLDPRLGPLADNGGPTFTHALLADSPAINAGNAPGAPAQDQRGKPRPHGLRADIGAFELNPFVQPLLDLNGFRTPGRNYNAIFLEKLDPVAVVDSANLEVDTEPATLSGAVITLQGRLNGAAETLAASTGGTAITATFDTGSGILALSGTDTRANYQQVLRSIKYDNSAYYPTSTVRTISFVVNDGTSTSPPVTTSLQVRSALVVTADSDNGLSDQFGTFSYAIDRAKLPGRGTAPVNKTVTFAAGVTDISVTGNPNNLNPPAFPLAEGVNIEGKCGGNGPQITINSVLGLALGGNNNLFGIALITSGGKTLQADTSQNNSTASVLRCVRLKRS